MTRSATQAPTQGETTPAAHDMASVTPVWSATDSVSGIADATRTDNSVNGKVDTGSPAGSKIFTASIKDKAGNLQTKDVPYKVNYAIANAGHFLQPINSDGSSLFKLGTCTIPCKFQILDVNNVPVEASVAPQIFVKFSDPTPDGTTVEGISSGAANVDNLFRYSTGQYIFNLSTKKLGMIYVDKIGDWYITAKLDSGQTITDRVSVKK